MVIIHANLQKLKIRAGGKIANLSEAVFLEVLPLNGGAEVESGVVNEIRRVFGQVQHHKIDAQPHNTN